MVAVPNDERERRTQRAPVPEAGQHLDLVGLDLLARTAPVALLTPAQVLFDALALEQEPGRKPGHDRDERRTVRLAGGGERQCHAVKTKPLRGARAQLSNSLSLGNALSPRR